MYSTDMQTRCSNKDNCIAGSAQGGYSMNSLYMCVIVIHQGGYLSHSLYMCDIVHYVLYCIYK